MVESLAAQPRLTRELLRTAFPGYEVSDDPAEDRPDATYYVSKGKKEVVFIRLGEYRLDILVVSDRSIAIEGVRPKQRMSVVLDRPGLACEYLGGAGADYCCATRSGWSFATATDDIPEEEPGRMPVERIRELVSRESMAPISWVRAATGDPSEKEWTCM